MENRSFYNEILTEHNVPPEFKHALPDADIVLEGVNPSCGDDIYLKLKMDGDTIVDGAFVGDGCAISQASADIMLGMIVGKKKDEALKMGETFMRMIKGEATDEEIEDQIEHFREHYFTFKDAPANTKVKVDSELTIAMKSTDDKGEAIESLSTEERPYTMGAGLLPEEFEEKLVGLKKGQTASFSVNVEDAKDATLMASLEGKTKTVNFEVEVLAVKKQVLPELTDEWVKDTLGFDDVADLRERVADSIKEQKEDVLPRMKENACLIELAKRLDVEVPAAVQEQTEAKLLQDFFSQLQNQGASFDMYLQQNGITADQFKADVKQQAADTAKQDMALDAWAAHFELKVTDEEVLEEFEKSGAKDPKALLKEWREGGRLYLVREALLRTHAVLDVMEKAKVTEYDPAEEAEEEKKAAKKSSKKAAKKEEEAADAEA